MNTENKIVAFTGHRSYRGAADEQLRDIIVRLYERGARTFRVGMAEGFDIHAAEAVIALMEHHADIILEAHIPWPEFSLHFDTDARMRYEQILRKVTITRYVSRYYAPDIFYRRNDMLVEGADVLVAWCQSKRSGTGYTVGRAKRLGCEVINLCEAKLFDTITHAF